LTIDYYAPPLDELLDELDDSELDELLDELDDSELLDDELRLDELDELLDDRLEELLDPAEPNIAICAKYLSIHFGSKPNLIGPFSLIFQTTAVRLFVQLNVTAPTCIAASNASSRTLSAAEI